jgi:uncharacterized membrane protein
MLKLLPLTAAECASSTSETTSENQRKSKIPHPATGGQTARIPGITRFSIPVHMCAELLAIPYFVMMAIVFAWWIPIVFFVGAGLLVGIVYERQQLVLVAPALVVFATPIGIALAVVALLL